MLHYFHKIGWRRNKEKEKENKEQQPLAWNFNFCLVALSYLFLYLRKKKRMETTKRLKKFNLGLKNIDEEEKYNQITKYR